MATKRYVSTNTKILGSSDIRGKGTTVYRTTLPTKVDPADDDVIVTPDEGERLDFLAAKYYGSPVYWYILASVNNLTNGSMHIPPGTQLRIPNRSRVI